MCFAITTFFSVELLPREYQDQELMSIPYQPGLYLHKYTTLPPPYSLRGFPPKKSILNIPRKNQGSSRNNKSTRIILTGGPYDVPPFTNHDQLNPQQQHCQSTHSDFLSQGGNSNTTTIINMPPKPEKPVDPTIVFLIHKNQKMKEIMGTTLQILAQPQAQTTSHINIFNDVNPQRGHQGNWQHV